ncbi:MAG: efflux transporter outer membrane subunit [Sphingomonadales bacterium]|nr:efflux transporter outer membrane subunit [Sphingomonadales bacterium]
MNRRRITAAALLASLTAGCAVGPDFHPPGAPAASGYTPRPITATAAAGSGPLGAAQVLTPGGAVAADWWAQFRSPVLDALIAAALAQNSDLAAAQAAVRVARESWLAQRGVLFPQIDAGASTSRNKSSNYLAPVPNVPSSIFSIQTAQVNVGYTLDLFGGNRRVIEQSRAQYDAQRFQAEATRITLINTVAATAFQEAALRAEVEAQTQIIGEEHALLAILERQRDVGQAAGADVLAQQAALAQAEAGLPPLQKALAQQQDLIAYLTGRSPAQVAGGEELDLAGLALPVALPLTLPAALVRQRPDIRAAEANLHAASAAVGVALAARLPGITLSASGGGVSNSWSNLLAAPNTFWSLGAGLTQPIFEGGTLLHRQRAAEAALDAAKAQYRSAVLAAFQNVADTLHALALDADALAADQAARQSAAASLAVAERQYRDGAIPFAGVLAAQQTLAQARQTELQAEAARLTDTAALFQALGGGWNSGG